MPVLGPTKDQLLDVVFADIDALWCVLLSGMRPLHDCLLYLCKFNRIVWYSLIVLFVAVVRLPCFTIARREFPDGAR